MISSSECTDAQSSQIDWNTQGIYVNFMKFYRFNFRHILSKNRFSLVDYRLEWNQDNIDHRFNVIQYHSYNLNLCYRKSCSNYIIFIIGYRFHNSDFIPWIFVTDIIQKHILNISHVTWHVHPYSQPPPHRASFHTRPHHSYVLVWQIQMDIWWAKNF